MADSVGWTTDQYVVTVATQQRTTRQVQAFSAGAADGDPARKALVADGVVCLRNAIARPWLDTIESGIVEALVGASADVDVVKREGDTGKFTFSSGAWCSVDGFRSYIFDSPLPDLVWPLLDSTDLTLFYDFLLIKEGHSDSAATPWHQDHSYYPIDGFKVVNSWVALDDIPAESALRFLAGSHHARTLYRAVDFEDPNRAYRHARSELPLPPDGIEPDAVLVAPLQAGDMLVWWSYTLHSAPGNSQPNRRAAFSVNWAGDDVTYNAKPALDTYLEPSLTVGAPIACEKFPRVRGGGEYALG